MVAWLLTVVKLILFGLGIWTVFRFWFYAGDCGNRRDPDKPTATPYDALLPVLFFLAALVARFLGG